MHTLYILDFAPAKYSWYSSDFTHTAEVLIVHYSPPLGSLVMWLCLISVSNSRRELFQGDATVNERQLQGRAEVELERVVLRIALYHWWGTCERAIHSPKYTACPLAGVSYNYIRLKPSPHTVHTLSLDFKFDTLWIESAADFFLSCFRQTSDYLPALCGVRISFELNYCWTSPRHLQQPPVDERVHFPPLTTAVELACLCMGCVVLCRMHPKYNEAQYFT